MSSRFQSFIGPRVPWTFNSERDSLEVPKKILFRVYLQEDKMRRANNAENEDLKNHFEPLMTKATADSTSLYIRFYNQLHQGHSRTRLGLIVLGSIIAFGFTIGTLLAILP